MAELQTKNNLSTEWCNNIQWVLLGSLTIGWGNFPAMTVPYVSCSWQVLKKIEVFSSTLLKVERIWEAFSPTAKAESC